MSRWESNKVTVNGLTLNYHRTGGDKPPLVMCHGLTDNGLCWTPVAQVLEKNYNVIMYDARGHGESDGLESGYGAKEHAADLAGLIEVLGLKRPRLMGHSMGGATVTYFIAHYPNVAACAVLEDPPFRREDMIDLSTEEREAIKEEWRVNTVARKEMSPEELLAFGKEIHPAWADLVFDSWVTSCYQVNLNALQFITHTQANWRDLIPKITTPTLLLTAELELDALLEPEVAQEIVDTQPNVTWVHIAQAGHSIRREQFEKYVEVVSTFLAEV